MKISEKCFTLNGLYIITTAIVIVDILITVQIYFWI